MPSVRRPLCLLASVVWATVAVSGAAVDVATECYRDDPSQLPPGNLFAAAGGDLWNNGAACGRVYAVRCVAASPSVPSSCGSDGLIQVKIIDNALSANSSAAAHKQSVTGATLVLSEEAFVLIAKPFADSVAIEFQ